MQQHFGLDFEPLLPWGLIAAGAVLALLVTVAAVLMRQKGGAMRALAFVLLLAGLANPSFINEDRDKLDDVVAVLVDRSPSQGIADRTAQTDRALADVKRQLALRPGTQVRIVEAGNAPDADGTRLFEPLQGALADVAPDRLAGIIAITDGQVHDIPPSLRALGFAAPFHALITGSDQERDRRLELVEAPRFGIVGKTQTIVLRLVETGASFGPAELTLRRDGEVIARQIVAPGQTLRLPVKVEHAGANLIEAEVTAAPGELTPVNNRVVINLEGVRDKLKVLLVSGEPHAGERTWRNLLKSDANVELVHFTILRPPEKQDGTPVNELSLIAFPHRELFGEKIKDFDLIIFDRYAVNQSIMPMFYLDNIARYVKDGGAVLLASGPEFAHAASLSATPLGTVIPARATGAIIERPYRAEITPVGKRHPVTRDLPGGNTEPPHWAPWLRLIGAEKRGGTTVMSGPNEAPLLLLSREERGRVALFLSDHAWLWARNYREGGPYIDLLRRLVHWLMKEPELEEEALRLTAHGNALSVERQTLGDAVPDATLTAPDGKLVKLALEQAEPGLWRGSFTAGQQGLWKAQDGKYTAIAIVGPPNPREFRDVASSTLPLQKIAEETGGSVRRLQTGGSFAVPRIVDIRAGSSFGGSDYIGMKPGEASVVRSVGLFGLTTGPLGLALLLGGAVAAWLSESRRRRPA